MTRVFVSYSSDMNPRRLATLLEKVGWRRVGGRRGVYTRLSPPDMDISSEPWSLVVPLDKAGSDYEDLMTAALSELGAHIKSDTWNSIIAPRLNAVATDSFKFQRESGTIAGTIPWKQGEELILSSRATLLAGAKSYREKQRRFSNRLGQFASRYLDNVLMGQTAVGSYIVTAHAPVHAIVPLTSSKKQNLELPDVDVVESRAVTDAVTIAIEAVYEGLEHQKSSSSFSAFEDGISRGVSYDLIVALASLIRDSDGAEITVEWDPLEPPEGRSSVAAFVFDGSASFALEQAAFRLVDTALPAAPTTLIGRVHLLTKKIAGGPGVFGLETLTHPVRRYRVRLSNSDAYHSAVDAHDTDAIIQVSGRLEPEGAITWLYDASIDGIIGHLSPDSPLVEDMESDNFFFEEFDASLDSAAEEANLAIEEAPPRLELPPGGDNTAP